MSLLLFCSVLLVILTAAKAQLSFNESTENRINVIVVLNDSNAGSFCTSEAEKLPSFSRLKSVDPNLEDRMEKQIKENILAKLGLSFPTNLSCPSGPPAFSVDHYKRVRNMIKPYLFKNGRDLPKYKYTVIFPIIVERPSPSREESSILMTFQINSRIRKEEIASANLWFVNPNFNQSYNWFRMTVWKIENPKPKCFAKNISIWVEGGQIVTVPVQQIGTIVGEENWYSITEWEPNKEYQLEITCPMCSEEGSPAMKGLDPFIVIKSFTKLRQKRNVGDNSLGHSYAISKECKWPLTISFTRDEMSNGIIYPESFDINYCYGSCNGQMSSRCPFSSSVVSSDTTKRHCCKPVRTSTLEVIQYQSPYIAIYSSFPDVIVDECGC